MPERKASDFSWKEKRSVYGPAGVDASKEEDWEAAVLNGDEGANSG